MATLSQQSWATPGTALFDLVGAGGGGPTGAAGPTGPAGPTGSAGPTGIVAGITNISTISTSIVVAIPGLLSTSVVVATYGHPGGGGAGQFFSAITEGTGQVTFGLAQNSAANDTIQWIARL